MTQCNKCNSSDGRFYQCRGFLCEDCVHAKPLINEDLNKSVSCGCMTILGKKTPCGAHGGGNKYQEFKVEDEFESRESLEEKSKPGKMTKPATDPGEGETGSKPNKYTAPKGFKLSKSGLPKEKDKPGKPTKIMPNEALDKTIDNILENFDGLEKDFIELELRKRKI